MGGAGVGGVGGVGVVGGGSGAGGGGVVVSVVAAGFCTGAGSVMLLPHAAENTIELLIKTAAIRLAISALAPFTAGVLSKSMAESPVPCGSCL